MEEKIEQEIILSKEDQQKLFLEKLIEDYLRNTKWSPEAITPLPETPEAMTLKPIVPLD